MPAAFDGGRVLERAVIEVRMLCAGAAKGLATALQPVFLAESGAAIRADFGAVGALKDTLLAGEPCDVIVVTAAMIAELSARGYVAGATIAPIGAVATGIAVRAGEALPEIADANALRKALRAANAVFIPDPQRSTAGIHFVDVLKRLHIDVDVAPRLHAYPNGATAMRELAQAPGSGLVGCTQVSEILYTPGVTLVGPLPGEYALSTTYSVAVCTSARQPDLARRFARLLTGPPSAQLRAHAGFDAGTHG